MAVTLLTLVMLTASLIGTAQACGHRGRCRKPTIATFEYIFDVWPVFPLPTDYEKIEGDNIIMGYKNLPLFGNYPLIDTYPPTVADYGKGGIKLTLSIGEEDFVLFGDVQKKIFLFILYANGRSIEIAEWSFTILDEGDAADLDAVGSSMEGWLMGRNGNFVVKSTGGTGVFEGAKLNGKQIITAYVAGQALMTHAVGWGQIKLVP